MKENSTYSAEDQRVNASTHQCVNAKPRLFINMHYLELGGAERALIGLLNALDTDRVDVDLFINQHTGAFMSLIPEKVILLPEDMAYSVIERPIPELVKMALKELVRGHIGDGMRMFGVLIGRMIGKCRYSRYHKQCGLPNEGSASQYAFDGVIPFLPSLKKYGHYDLAISFLDPPHIVQDKVDAAKTVEWIHTDFSTVNMDAKTCGARWAKNDYIASISSIVTEQFLKTFPGLGDRIFEIHNILSPSFVRQQAELPIDDNGIFEKNKIVLMSVGRICYAKNYECIPRVAQILKERGMDFIWIIVGPGDHSAIDKSAADLGVSDRVSFIGPKDNPYPYMKNCDIYVQPSRFEGNSVTVREAQMLYRPVVITNYATAKNQVRDGVDGVICEMNEEGIVQAILSLQDVGRRETIINNLRENDYGNEEEVEKIYKLLRV